MTFFSCDWGTSSFRLRLIESSPSDHTVLAEVKSGQGIAATYKSWKDTNGRNDQRLAFYQSYLFEQVQKIALQLNQDLYSLPVVLSGMISSSIGMQELPYKQLPFLTDGSDITVQVIPSAIPPFTSPLLVISGASSANDVMRGEETILIGCDIPNSNEEELLIFPGTHSKHVMVKNGRVISITTYMTGELFQLLSQQSVLSGSVQSTHFAERYAGSFAEGVRQGRASNFLSNVFQVRINHLFSRASAEENYFYLSGLLIGHEIKDISQNFTRLSLVSSGELQHLYHQALSISGLNISLRSIDADRALINGQRKILQQHYFSQL